MHPEEPAPASRAVGAAAAAAAAGSTLGLPTSESSGHDTPATDSSADSAPAQAAPSTAETSSEAIPPPALAPAELVWRQRLFWLAIPALAAVVGLGIWSLASNFGGKETLQEPAPTEAGNTDAVAGTDKPVPPAEQLPEAPSPDSAAQMQRWIPADSRFVLIVSLPQQSDRTVAAQAASMAGRVWSRVFAPAFAAFGLEFSAIRRVVWAAEQWNDWPHGGVLFVELASGHDAHLLEAKGTPTETKIAGNACRQLDPSSPWPLAFAVLDEHSFVSAAPSMLATLADREQTPGFSSPSMEYLWKAMPHDGRLLVVADLGGVPDGDRERFTALLDVWPELSEPWRILCEAPLAMGIASRGAADAENLIALRCDSPAVADQLRSAVGQLIPAAGKLLEQSAEQLSGERSAETGPEASKAFARLVDLLKQWLEQAQWEVSDQTVWIRCGNAQSPLVLAAGAANAGSEIHRRWLVAARGADAERHRAIGSSLKKYHDAEGSFPPGVGGAELLPPETRLSWIAMMLPYLGHRDWHAQLEFGYSWNSPQNRPITTRRLSQVTNPSLGPQLSRSGFPVTHYVGVAGVGPDAARLPADDPRAGVFGYSRTMRLDQIPDGASNTLALLGASGKLGPWASGGMATVRSLTARPYVNGPDGFGSGQPDGMLATMADGSVRFISKDVDPEVLEQLAAAGDGGRPNVAALAASAQRNSDTAEGDHTAERSGQPSLDLRGDRRPSGAEPTSPSDAAAEPQAKRPGEQPGDTARPGRVDLQSALALKLAAAKLPGVRLIDAVRLISSLTAVPISFDLDTLVLLGHSVYDKVDVQFRNSTAQQLLAKVLESEHLAYVVDGGHLIVTVPEAERMTLRTVRYTVSDLAGQEESSTRQLAEWIVAFVAPETWKQNGGRGSVSTEPGLLVVSQTEVVHRQIIVFCEKLRTARGLPLRSRLDRKQFTLQTRYDRVRNALSKPISANFSEPTPLRRILDDLEQLSGLTLVVDHRALAEEGVVVAVPTSINVQNEPLEAVLDELLLPQGLVWRPIDAGTLEVTTRKAAAGRLVLEFYRVADQLGEQLAPAELLDRIKGQVGGGTWTDAGGPGVIRFDGPSKCLLVLQSQPVQVELQGLLETWRNDAGQR